ncbi:MAG: hypothetical protein ACXADY_15785, partial [Candidatus Hodarchaeales archaeon]
MKYRCIAKNSILLTVIILLCFFIEIEQSPISGVPIQRGLTLFLVENNADNDLATALNRSLNINGDIIDIQTSEDLNTLFFNQNYLDTYFRIIMILNQVTSPFNETVVERIDNFVQAGGVFIIISSQIWRFPTSFHTLLGLHISFGQKEWPTGNTAGNITITIMNDTFTKVPFQFHQNSTLNVLGSLGITTTIDDSFCIATSQNNSEGKTTITGFVKQAGFISAIPLSLTEYNSSLTSFKQFVTSVITSGIEFSPQSGSDDDPPIIPLFNISVETAQAGVTIVSVTFLLLGLAYIISKWATHPNPNPEIPKDRDWFSLIILSPLLLLGQIIYPPVIRRINEYDVLENQYRNQIIDILERWDFLHFRELKRELQIGISSLRWHLQVLEDFRITKRKVFGQYEIVYLLRNEPSPDFLQLYFAIISGVGFR